MVPGVNIDIGKVTDFIKPAVEQVAKHYLPDPIEREKLAIELEKVLSDEAAARFDAMARVMVADAQSEDKFTRRARPMTVYWSMAMISGIFTLALFSVAEAKAVVEVMGIIPEGFWTLCTVGVGVFGLSRGLEKGAKIVAAGR